MSAYRHMPMQDPPKRSVTPPWWRRLLCGMGRHDVIENGWVDEVAHGGVVRYVATFYHRCGHVGVDPKFATFPHRVQIHVDSVFHSDMFDRAVESKMVRIIDSALHVEAPTLTPFATSVRSCATCGAGLALVDFGDTVLCTGCGASSVWDK